MVVKSVPSFQVVYKKHTLTLDDLCTLADQNWLNDQVQAESASQSEHVRGAADVIVLLVLL